MQLAHVLFTDIVGYSKLPTDQQTSTIRILKDIVRDTAEVKRARASGDLISLPTGDGVALVFFNEPTAPVNCAMEISRALRGHPEIKLRMGIHSGPVDKIDDVNNSINVAGAGINMAQRVMDSGDAGHILLSRRVAEDLSQYSTWQPFLHDLKEVEVKHGIKMHVFNLHDGDVGNPQLPERIRRSNRTSKILPIAAIVVLLLAVAVGSWVYLRGRSASDVQPAVPQRPEREFTVLFQKKTDSWVDSLFAAQAADGGLKAYASAPDKTVQAWATAQALVAVFATKKDCAPNASKIKAAFDYIEKKRRTNPAGGWNYYDNASPFTITEINAWVAIAYIRSLEPTSGVWNPQERQDVLKRIVRELDEIGKRQDDAGGWRPIRDTGNDYARTYSTIMALWAMSEAKLSADAGSAIGGKYDESIRKGTNWLLRTYNEGQGWVPNPIRSGQKDHFEGLTAQTLYVLSRERELPQFSYLKDEPAFRTARKDFIANKYLATRSIEKENSHVPDADINFVNTEFMAEGSSFLWFPWTLLELSRLSSDADLTPDEQKTASELRNQILNSNADVLGTYVETANFTYQYAENLFCAAEYTQAVGQ
jgi:class 3 adenylate cyclase